jgi:hypothetical protein
MKTGARACVSCEESERIFRAFQLKLRFVAIEPAYFRPCHNASSEPNLQHSRSRRKQVATKFAFFLSVFNQDLEFQFSDQGLLFLRIAALMKDCYDRHRVLLRGIDDM